MIISKQTQRSIMKLMMKLLVDDGGKLQLWVRVLPWFLMACFAVVTLAYAYSLIR